jgi:hypothetical protein
MFELEIPLELFVDAIHALNKNGEPLYKGHEDYVKQYFYMKYKIYIENFAALKFDYSKKDRFIVRAPKGSYRAT